LENLKQKDVQIWERSEVVKTTGGGKRKRPHRGEGFLSGKKKENMEGLRVTPKKNEKR